MPTLKKSFTKTIPADLLGLAGLAFFGRCGLKLLQLHQTADAFIVLAILIIWLILCVCVLRKQKRA